MSGADSIVGTVDNGARGIAAFGFYAGPVGIRQRDGYREVAFFAPLVRLKLPVEGLLDGESVRVTAVSVRELDPGSSANTRGKTLRAIVATVIPVS